LRIAISFASELLTSSGKNFTRGCIARKYFIYFILRFFAPMLRNDIDALQRSSSNRFREKHGGTESFPILMCLDFVTYCYCCRTPWPLRSSLGAVTVGNLANARGFYCRLKTGFVSNLHFLSKHSRVHQAFSGAAIARSLVYIAKVS